MSSVPVQDESSPRPQRGVCLGKFMPPHRGHQYLIDFARHHAESLTVLCCSLSSEPIAGTLRVAWLREMYAATSVEIVHVADDSLPQVPEDDPDTFWSVWRDVVWQHAGRVDAFYASEPYGWPMAEALGCEFVPVDLARELRAVSGTAIRRAPHRHFDDLPEVVRPHFVKTVCVYGPESTGKSMLSKQLAKHFNTRYVHEYARPLLDTKQGRCDREDLPRIARGQAAAIDAIRSQSGPVLFTDTDCLTTRVWSEVLFDEVDPVVAALADAHLPDFYLLLDVDVPWVDDEQRCFGEPTVRRAMFERFEAALIERQRPYVVIRGNWNTRFRAACEAVEQLLNAGVA